MKVSVAFLAIFLLAITALGQEQSQTESQSVNPQWFVYGYPHPYFGFHHPSFSFPGGANHFHLPSLPPMSAPEFSHPTFPMPELPPISDDQKKCSEAFHGIQSCLSDLHNFFQSHKIVVGSDCCSALQNINDACKSVQNPFFKNLVIHQCSNGDAPPSS